MKKGFTLVEITVALALFALSVVVLSQSFLGGMFSLNSFKFDDSTDEALQYVSSKIISLENRADIENGGVFITANKGLAQWSANVQSTDVLELYKITMNISFDEGKSSKSYTDELYVYKPAWGNQQERNQAKHKKRTAVNEKEV